MRTKLALMLMLCGIASVAMVTASQADILSQLMANPPLAPNVDRQGPVARPAHATAPQRTRSAHEGTRPQTRTVLITPTGAQSSPQRVAAAQPFRAAEIEPQQYAQVKPTTRHALATDLRPASVPGAASRVRVARKSPVVRAQRSHPPMQQQAQPLLASAYHQAARTAYAQRPAQARTYAPATNYYPGYAYQGWGSTNPAACGPGRA